MSASRQFMHGMSAPWRGFKTIAAFNQLWPFAVAPVIITSVLLVGALFTALWASGPLTRWLLPGLGRWWLLFVLARGAMMLALGLLLAASSTMLSALLCLPINDALSQRIEEIKGVLPTPLTFREALPISIAHSMAGFALWIVLEALLFPVQVIPVIGSLLELVLGFAITAFFLAHQLVDGAMSRRRMTFEEKFAWMREHAPYVLGLGSMGTLMIAIPLVNSIGLPIAIAGGTLLFLEIEEGV